MYYTIKEIENENKEILKSNKDFINYNNFIEIENIKENNKNEIEYKITNNLNILENNINYNLFNDKINYYDVLNVNLCITPIIENNDDYYYFNHLKTIKYYEYNNYCFKEIDDLKQYIFNQYHHHLQSNFYYNIEIDIEDIKDIFYFFNDDIENSIINCYVSDEIDDIINNIYEDLFNNYVYKEIKDIIKYKDFKVYYDDRLLNYINNFYLYDVEIDEDIIKNFLINDNINSYKDYLNSYYNLTDQIDVYYYIEIYDDNKNDVIEKYFKDDYNLIDYLIYYNTIHISTFNKTNKDISLEILLKLIENNIILENKNEDLYIYDTDEDITTTIKLKEIINEIIEDINDEIDDNKIIKNIINIRNIFYKNHISSIKYYFFDYNNYYKVDYNKLSNNYNKKIYFNIKDKYNEIDLLKKILTDITLLNNNQIINKNNIKKTLKEMR